MDCDDDGETHAGSRLAHLLDIIDAPNHLVVVRYAHSLGIDAPPHTHIFGNEENKCVFSKHAI